MEFGQEEMKIDTTNALQIDMTAGLQANQEQLKVEIKTACQKLKAEL